MLFYNLQTNKAICLNATAAQVYGACDGNHDVIDLAVVTGLEKTDVARALRNLNKQGLLQDGFDAPTTLSRRDAFTTLAKGAAGVAPVVMAISVPTAAMAMSCGAGGDTCVSDLDCCSGACISSRGRGRCT